MKYSFKPHRVCSVLITFEIRDNKIFDVNFTGGCDGNLKAISKLVDGMNCDDVIKILRGNDCRGRGTSCADQLAVAIENAIQEENGNKQ